MRVLTPSDYKQTLWKNGGGRTDELLVHPHAGSTFLWRISIATIAASGPFSVFPGIDRIIMTLSGPTVHLDFATGRSQELEQFVPFAFSGEDQIFGRLAACAGVATDFNVMTRRADCAATLSCDQLVKECTMQLDPQGHWMFMYVISGTLCMSAGREKELLPAHSLFLEPRDQAVILQATSDCRLAVTKITKNWPPAL